MIIDTHCHLNDEIFNSDLNECINRAKENGIDKMILVGFDYKTNLEALNLSSKYNCFYPAIGIHPSCVLENDLSYLNFIIENKDKIYAVGEIGLDFHYGKENMEEQILFFKKQLDIACFLNKPVIIHCRDAYQMTYDILKEYQGKLKGVMHCYSGSYEMMKEFIKLGFLIGIGGVVTFKNALEIKKCVLNIPLRYLVLETDCPYLAPVPFRGKRNEPAYLKYIIDEIASIKNILASDIIDITTKNALKLFNIID